MPELLNGPSLDRLTESASSENINTDIRQTKIRATKFFQMPRLFFTNGIVITLRQTSF